VIVLLLVFVAVGRDKDDDAAVVVDKDTCNGDEGSNITVDVDVARRRDEEGDVMDMSCRLRNDVESKGVEVEEMDDVLGAE